MRRCAGAVLLLVVFIGPWHESWIDAVVRFPAWPPARAPIADKVEIAVGPLQVGAATIDISDLAAKSCLAGYGKRAFRSNTGKADNIRVSAVVVKNGARKAAIVSGDLLLVNRWLADAVHAKLFRDRPEWRRSELYFGATHTHSGPGGFSGRSLEAIGMGWHGQAFADGLAQAMADAIAAADAKAETAEWRRIAVQAPGSTVANRTRQDGPTNRWLDCVEFRRPGSDKLLASLVVFGAHATCRPSDDDRLSGDYPGHLQRLAEAELGGTCSFLAGGVGSQAPGQMTTREKRDAELAEALFACWKEARQAAPAWQSTMVLCAMRRQVELPPPAVKFTQRLRASPIVAGLLLPTHTELQCLRLGDAVFVGAPADFSGPLAEELRSAAPNCMTIVTSFAGDYVGYVIDDADYDLPKYEPRQMVFYGRKLGAYFLREVKNAANEISK